MLTDLKLQNLHERLACYLESNNDVQYDEALYSMILSSIIENVEFDETKLVRALDMLNRMKNNRVSTEFQQMNNMFDVSTQTSKTFVKGFLSKGRPILYFYRHGEDLPFYKLKSVIDDFGQEKIKIETANTPSVLAERKHKAIDSGSYYLRVLDITKHKNNFTYHNVTRARAGDDDLFIISKDNFPDEYKLFYSFLQASLKNNGIELPDNMSATKFDFIFLELYEKIKKCIEDVPDFSMTDLLMIMHATINGQKVSMADFSGDGTLETNINSMVARTIAASEYDENNRKKDYRSRSIRAKDEILFHTVQASNYMSIDISRGGVPYSSYVMGLTNHGFTLFKSNKNQDKSANDDFVMLTFNLTDNMFRFSATYDEMISGKSNQDIIMQIMPEGELVLSSDLSRGKSKASVEQVQQIAMI